jgi:ribosomal protein L22
MSAMAQLYSTSVLEHHHFDQCIMILNTKGNEILSNLRQDQYERVIKILENAILATDLALYFRYVRLNTRLGVQKPHCIGAPLGNCCLAASGEI